MSATSQRTSTKSNESDGTGVEDQGRPPFRYDGVDTSTRQSFSLQKKQQEQQQTSALADDASYIQLSEGDTYTTSTSERLENPRYSVVAATMAETGIVVGGIAGGVHAVIPVSVGEGEEVDQKKKTIPIAWALLVMGSYVIVGGVLFAQWESWSVLDGCYFCYISLSTIGFGDLVPGRIVAGQADDSQQVDSKQIICTIYLLVGMALVAMCFNLMQEEAIENLKAFWRSLGCLRKHVKRGRDKIRGRRRLSQMTGDNLREFELRQDGVRAYSNERHGVERHKRHHSQHYHAQYWDTADNSRQLDRRRHHSNIDVATVNVPDRRRHMADSSDANTIIVSDYDRKYDILRNIDEFRRVSEAAETQTLKKNSVRSRDENLEMKYFRDGTSKKWTRQRPDYVE